MKDFNLFIYCWMAIGMVAGLYLLRIEAPYGRFSKTNWGPMISNRLAWMLMEFTVMVVFVLFIPFNRFKWHTPATIMIILFLIHNLHRSLVYPFMIRTKGKKMPVVIMLSAMLFNAVNGSLLGFWFSHLAHYPANWFLSPAFIMGCILFVAGMTINWTSDYQLIRLRKQHETDYKIPQTGLFKLLASPNLLGEIIEWGGFALLTWSLPALAFFVWTCANLVPRAIANRRWYRKQFPDYPSERNILIPYLW